MAVHTLSNGKIIKTESGATRDRLIIFNNND